MQWDQPVQEDVRVVAEHGSFAVIYKPAGLPILDRSPASFLTGCARVIQLRPWLRAERSASCFHLYFKPMLSCREEPHS